MGWDNHVRVVHNDSAKLDWKAVSFLVTFLHKHGKLSGGVGDKPLLRQMSNRVKPFIIVPV